MSRLDLLSGSACGEGVLQEEERLLGHEGLLRGLLPGGALVQGEGGGSDDAQRERQQDTRGRRRQDAVPAPPLGSLDFLALAGQALLLEPLLDAGEIPGHGRGDLAAVRRAVGAVRGQAAPGQSDQLRIRPAAIEPGGDVCDGSA